MYAARFIKLLVMLAPLLATATALRPQTEPCLQRTVAVNILDNGKQVDWKISPENLQASYHHEQLKVLSVTMAHDPRVIIVFDASASMTSNKVNWNTYLDVAREVLKMSSKDTQLGLVVFATQVEKTLPLTRDPVAIQEELDALTGRPQQKIRGLRRTALFDAMGQALSLFGPLEPGDALYVISHGEEIGSRLTANDLEHFTGSVRVFAYGTHLFSSKSTIIPEGVDTDGLIKLVEHSGGYAIGVPVTSFESETGRLPQLLGRPDEASSQQPIVSEQFHRVESYYRVELEPLGAIESKSTWNLKLLDPRDSRAHHIEVLYPKYLFPCEQPGSKGKRPS